MPEQDSDRTQDLLTLHDLACLTGLSEPVIRRLVALEVLEPVRRDPAPVFQVQIVARVRRMRRLHVDVGVSWSSMPLVLELLRRIEELEDRLNAGRSREQV